MNTSFLPLSSRVVMYGKDLILLNTRAWVLRSESFLIHCVSEYGEAEELIFNNQCDVVILCHSIPSSDRDSLRAALRELRPFVPCLLLVATSAVHPLMPNETAIDILNGPTALILTLNQMTGRHANSASTAARMTTFRRG